MLKLENTLKMAGTFRKRPFKAVIWQAQNQFVEACEVHHKIGCITNPKENGMYGSKQSINDKAVDDSDVPLLETKTNEVAQILNKFPTCVLIIPSKEIKGEENDEIQVLQPSKQPNKVTQVLTSHQPFQSMSTPENVSMTDAPEDDNVQVGLQTP